MPRNDKSSYSDKQKCAAKHVEQGYEDRGVGKKESEPPAWAAVNKETGRGAIALAGECRGDTQANRNGKVGPAQRRAQETACGGNPLPPIGPVF